MLVDLSWRNQTLTNLGSCILTNFKLMGNSFLVLVFLVGCYVKQIAGLQASIISTFHWHNIILYSDVVSNM